MLRVIDIHTHFFPKEDLEQALKTFGEEYWLNLLFPKVGKGLQGFPTQAQFIADMDEANVDMAIINGAYWQSQQACDYFNATALEFAKRHPRRIYPLAIINPRNFEESVSIIKNAKSQGFVGIGELCDSVQGFEVLSKAFLEIVELCQEESLPMCFHLSDELGKDYKGKCITNNDALFALALKFPKQKFVFSHLGGGRAFSQMSFPENIYFDTAAFPLLYKKQQWRNLPKEALRNLCFATDYSLKLYPKSCPRENFLLLKEEALEFIPKDMQENFFSKNAQRLFGIF